MKRALNFFYQQTGKKQPNIAELYDIERQRKNVFNRVTHFNSLPCMSKTNFFQSTKLPIRLGPAIRKQQKGISIQRP